MPEALSVGSRLKAGGIRLEAYGSKHKALSSRLQACGKTQPKASSFVLAKPKT